MSVLWYCVNFNFILFVSCHDFLQNYLCNMKFMLNRRFKKYIYVYIFKINYLSDVWSGYYVSLWRSEGNLVPEELDLVPVVKSGPWISSCSI